MSQAGGDLQVSSTIAAPPDRMTYQRWVICALLFFATVIAYVDRAVIANLKNTLEGVIPGLNDYKYGIITVAFQVAYGIAHARRRRTHRQAGHAQGVRDRHYSVERRSHAAGRGVFGRQFRAGHVSARAGRGGKLPCLHQNCGRVVSQARAGVRNRTLQLRRECGQHGGAAGGRGVRGPVQSMECVRAHESLARLILRRRRNGLRVACFLAHCLSPA